MLFTAQEVVTPSQAKSHQGRQASKARRDCVVISHKFKRSKWPASAATAMTCYCLFVFNVFVAAFSTYCVMLRSFIKFDVAIICPAIIETMSLSLLCHHTHFVAATYMESLLRHH